MGLTELKIVFGKEGVNCQFYSCKLHLRLCWHATLKPNFRPETYSLTPQVLNLKDRGRLFKASLA